VREVWKEIRRHTCGEDVRGGENNAPQVCLVCALPLPVQPALHTPRPPTPTLCEDPIRSTHAGMSVSVSRAANTTAPATMTQIEAPTSRSPALACKGGAE